MFPNASQILFTLAHYRPSQLLYKAWYSIRSGPAGALRPVPRPPSEIPASRPVGHKVPFLLPPHLRTHAIRKGRFSFLNVTRRMGQRIDWHPQGIGRLWIYNLHYFDYLPGLLCEEPGRAWGLVDQWIDANPPGCPDAWDPYPVSLRIVNWVQALSMVPAPGRLSGKVIRSLYQQASWLESSLEKHLLANHYFKNAKALVFAGVFFQGDDADHWLRTGLSILEGQVLEQILSDGGHFERSPMYHAMILKDCLDLLNLDESGLKGRDPGAKRRWEAVRMELAARIPTMLVYLAAMSHPDGRIALFNDAALGIEPETAHLEGYARAILGRRQHALPSHLRAFPDSGYYVLAPSEKDRLIVDCGPLGPDYQPGHGHCDALSFELSLEGRRVIVDSGTYAYESGDMRRYNRGNVGHNTVTIDAEDQSQVWGAHRCGRRSRPVYTRWERTSGGALVIDGAHDGYHRLPGKPVHHRRIVWQGMELRIRDRVEGRGIHCIENRLHLHPDLEVEKEERAVVVREKGRGIATLVAPCRASLEVDQGWYCPEFGIKRACPVLVTCWKGRLPYEGGWTIRRE